VPVLLSPEQMKEDILFYYDKLIETHPNPFHKTGKEEFEKLKNDILSGLNKSLSTEDFYNIISQFNNLLDNHTQIFEKDDVIIRPLNEKEKLGKIAINDKRAYPYRLFCFPQDSIALLELNTFSMPEIAQMDPSDFLNFNFNIKTLVSDYKKILAEKMDSIVAMNCKHLFIDVSANGGGSSLHALAILDFLKQLDRKKYYIGSSDTKISSAYRKIFKLFSLSSVLDYVAIPFKRRYRQVFLGKEGKIIHHEHYENYKGTNQVYDGNIYLIQSRASASATMDLCAFFKNYKVGIIFGKETDAKICEYNNCCMFKLPNSEYLFLCAMSYDKLLSPDGNCDVGIVPDIQYNIENPYRSFNLEQLKEMLELAKKRK
jgi:C-terminal processing protease CtpA/Prc